MKELGCVRAGMLLDGRASGLSQANSLRLEEHLATCEACRQDAERLDGMRALADRVDGTLSQRARARAIGAALAEAQPQRMGLAAVGTRQSLRVAMAIAAAALLAFAVRWGVGREVAPRVAVQVEAPITAPVAAPALARTDRILSGKIEVDGRVQERGAALESATVLRASEAARVALMHADVDLRAGTEVRWDQATRVLRLEAGSVVADVDPSAHRSFTVETPRFRVLVLGTRFSVSLDTVNVERGRVRVISADPNVAPALLDAGEQFNVASPPAIDAAPSAPGEATRPERHKPQVPSKSAAELLGEARAQLAAQHIAGARHALDAALALGPERALRAEALSLRAECALVEGDLGGAVEGYLRVARAFTALPAGQNALYAAARIEADRGHSAAAAQLLERYLTAYPQGHFVREARARLQELSAALDRAP